MIEPFIKFFGSRAVWPKFKVSLALFLLVPPPPASSDRNVAAEYTVEKERPWLHATEDPI